ncbi:hypothetical protein A3715_17600 [Oleiphilus sp. HI0009]|nr:hypothetical protein A3715_17600 [Oleiphilus sp. HI0009]
MFDESMLHRKQAILKTEWKDNEGNCEWSVKGDNKVREVLKDLLAKNVVSNSIDIVQSKQPDMDITFGFYQLGQGTLMRPGLKIKLYAYVSCGVKGKSIDRERYTEVKTNSILIDDVGATYLTIGSKGHKKRLTMHSIKPKLLNDIHQTAQHYTWGDFITSVKHNM